MRKLNIVKAFAVMVMAGFAALAGATTGPWGEGQGRAYLGIHVGNITPARVTELSLKSSNGAVVLQVDQDGPACKAGLKENDVILAVNGKKVEDSDQLAEMMTTIPAGQPATVTVWRKGQSRDIKVVPANRHQWMAGPSGSMAFAFAGGPPAAPMAPMAAPAPLPSPEIDMPLFTPTVARQGLMVEAMSPQLADFFGVPRGRGVLVRDVQKGSPGAAAGLRAGDVILKVNGEEIHDVEDWRQTLRSRPAKLSLKIVRDKHEQALEMTLPAPGSGALYPQDWSEFEKNMNAFQQQMNELQPQLEQQAQDMQQMSMLMNRDELDQMQRDIDKSINKSMKKIDPEMKRQTKAIQKQMKDIEPQIRRQSEEIQKQMRKMQPEIERQTREAQKQIQVMGPELAKQAAEMQKMVLMNSKELKDMQRSIQDSMKTLGPELHKQMEEMRKQMEQMKKDWGKDTPAPNEM